MTATLDTATAAVMTTGPQLRTITKWVLGLKGAPAEGAVRVTVAGTELIVVSTDFETVRIADVELDQAEPGTATVIIPGLALKAAVEALPKGKQPVEVSVQDGVMADITTEPGTTRAHRVSIGWDCGRGWPDLPATPALATAVDFGVFAEVTRRVAVAACGEPMLPWLGSIRMHGDPDGGLWLTATDRYKIGAEKVACDPACDGDWMFPAREADAWTRVAGGPVAYLLADQGQLVGLTDGTWTVLTKRVTGDPVDVRQWMPAQEVRHPFTAQVTVDAEGLGSLLTGTGGAAKIKGALLGGKTIRETAYVDVAAVPGEQLTLTLQRGEQPWGPGHVDAQVDGPKLVAGWDPRYLGAILGVLSGPVVIRLAPGDDGRVLNPARITCEACPGWTGWLAMIDPSK